MASTCDLFSARWFVRETHNLQVADRIRNVAEFLLIRGLFLIFLIAIYRAAFCRVLASVCEEQRRLFDYKFNSPDFVYFIFCFFFRLKPSFGLNVFCSCFFVLFAVICVFVWLQGQKTID